MDRFDVERKYREWWVGKLCRLAGQTSREFKRVTDVSFTGPPSGIYGVAEIFYEDGTMEMIVPFNANAFKPRKKDVEVFTFEVRK